MLIEFIEFIIL